MTAQPDPQTLGYEDARDELVDVVRRLEAGSATLEESLALWERGEALAARCEAWLAGARARIDARSGAAGGPDGGPAGPGAAAAPGRGAAVPPADDDLADDDAFEDDEDEDGA